jgi:SAM-dependent methyltransferase
LRAVRLLREALTLEIETVADCAVGSGHHAIAFLSQGKSVIGIDTSPAKISHPRYRHVQERIENIDLVPVDLVWSSHTLEHVENPGLFLSTMRRWIKPGGWLAIAVPPGPSEYFHVGHLSTWTPANLMYHLVVSGWNCKEAKWYTEDWDIAVLIQKVDDIDMAGRTGMLSEKDWLQQYWPIEVEHVSNAWWPNRWHEPTRPRIEKPWQLMRDRLE